MAYALHNPTCILPLREKFNYVSHCEVTLFMVRFLMQDIQHCKTQNNIVRCKK